MMRYEVRGAESATGKDVRLEFEAKDPEEARQMANYNGVMVESVGAANARAKGTPVMAYALPDTPRGIAAPTSSVAPTYTGIVKGARLLNRVAARYRSTGFLLIGLSILIAAVGVWRMASQDPARGLIILLIAIGPAALAQVLFTRATVMELLANVSEAMRDTAQNSFK